MALIKSIALPTGVTAEYFRLVGFRWDRNAREASAQFALYKDAATAAAGQPLVPVAAKLRLERLSFDEYLSPSALSAADDDVVAQLYNAAKDACDEFADNEVMNPAAHVVSDLGQGVFADAQDG
jgi:hypothetical protein